MTGFQFATIFAISFVLTFVLGCQGAQNNQSLADAAAERKQMSAFGSLCYSDCILHGNWPSSSYYACKTYLLIEDPNTYVLGPSWEYCSPQDNYDYYGRKCRDSCGFQGYSYQWCWTVDDSWGYCGTTQVVTKVERPLTIYGETCADPCETVAQHGTVCEKGQIFSRKLCSPYEGYSTQGRKCVNECGNQGYNYGWCYLLGGSWDYCSLPVTFKTPVQSIFGGFLTFT